MSQPNVARRTTHFGASLRERFAGLLAAGRATLLAMRTFFDNWFDGTKQRALVALAIRVVGAGLAYVMQIALAQWMAVEQYGIFAGVWVWLLVLSGVAPLGLDVTVIGQVAGYRERGDAASWRGVMLVSSLVALIAGCLIAATGLAMLNFMPELMSTAYMLPVWLSLFCIPLMAMGNVCDGIARAHGWINTALVPPYVLRPILLILSCFALLTVYGELDAAMAIGAAIFAALATTLVQAAALGLRVMRIGDGRDVSAQPYAWIVAALPIVVMQTFELLTENFDLMAVSYFLGPAQTGLYFAALKTIALLAFVNFAVGAATANDIAAHYAAGRQEELQKSLSAAVNLAFWPTLLGAIVLVLLAPFLLSLFGERFSEAAYITAILAVGFVVRGITGPAALYLNVLGHQRTCAGVLICAAIVNAVLNVVFIPIYGLAGAAIATTISLIVLTIGLYVAARICIGVSLRPSLPFAFR